jgi:hypothetical protein
MMKNAMDSEYGIFGQLTICLRKSPYQTWILFYASLRDALFRTTAGLPLQSKIRELRAGEHDRLHRQFTKSAVTSLPKRFSHEMTR